MRENLNNELQNYSTATLVEELRKRDGVKAMDAAPYTTIDVSCTGPVILLIVED